MNKSAICVIISVLMRIQSERAIVATMEEMALFPQTGLNRQLAGKGRQAVGITHNLEGSHRMAITRQRIRITTIM